MASYHPDYYSWQQDGSLRSAKQVVPMVMQYLRPSSVIDVGCGVGTWLTVFKEHGVEDICGVDQEPADPGMLRIDAARFIRQDLREPLHIDRRFDLVVALEVAEHLPPESGKIFIDSLVGLGPVILFSAAIPHQGGYCHVNEQWPDFWARYFLNHGYEAVDCLRSKLWDNEEVEWWYAQNMMFYVKRSCLDQYPELKKHHDPSQVVPLSVVHPQQYLGLARSLNK